MSQNTPCAPSAGAPRAIAEPDLGAIKQRQQATWSSGDYAVIGTRLQIVGETLCEAADVRANERVLDVAAGNGNASLAAARRFAQVTATDYVPALLEKARARAAADELPITFQVADAEALPFADASFDVALSTFGVMFSADHARAAAELQRVVRPGGRIAMANWTPEGFIGQVFKIIGAHVPPPAGVRSPALWGTQQYLAELFAGAGAIQAARKLYHFRFASPAHFLQVFRDYYGPTLKAYGALDEAGRQALTADLTALLERCNTAGAASLVVPSEYLEVVITKRSA